MPTYGPFHRRRNFTTQTDDDIDRQVASAELWGKPRRDSGIPQVQAWDGELPVGRPGFEFYTDVAPDRDTVPGSPRWIGPRLGVVVDDDFAKIAIYVSRYVK